MLIIFETQKRQDVCGAPNTFYEILLVYKWVIYSDTKLAKSIGKMIGEKDELFTLYSANTH